MITKCYYPFAYERLTLILPGEVKVDLANFDVKFWTKFLNIGFLCNFPIPAELYSKFFLIPTWRQKMTFWHPFWHFFIRSLLQHDPANPPCFLGFYCYYRPPEHGKSPTGPWTAVRWWRQSIFLSVSGPGPRRVRGVGRFSVGPALSLFLGVVMLTHRSGQIYETAALYYTCQIPGEVSLHLMKARSKLNRPRWFMDFLNPGWIRVKTVYYVGARK